MRKSKIKLGDVVVIGESSDVLWKVVGFHESIDFLVSVVEKGTSYEPSYIDVSMITMIVNEG